MINLNSLPKATKGLFLKVVNASKGGLLDDMVLIGGSALAMRLEHRFSEDLDFTIGSSILPVKKLAAIIKNLGDQGCQVIDILSNADRDNFTNDGLDVENYHQDWLVDGVKLTFFTYGDEYETSVINSEDYDIFNDIKIASIDVIAKTKCHVVTKRTKSRDLFDINYLIQSDLLTIADVIGEMQKCNPHMTYDTAVYRLIEKPIQADDEGLSIVGGDVNIEDIRNKLKNHISALNSLIAHEYKLKIGAT